MGVSVRTSNYEKHGLCHGLRNLRSFRSLTPTRTALRMTGSGHLVPGIVPSDGTAVRCPSHRGEPLDSGITKRNGLSGSRFAKPAARQSIGATAISSGVELKISSSSSRAPARSTTPACGRGPRECAPGDRSRPPVLLVSGALRSSPMKRMISMLAKFPNLASRLTSVSGRGRGGR